MIEGVAINQTTTRNGHVFKADELEKSAPSLQGRPLLKDHNNSVDSVIGKVTESRFDTMQKCVRFKALVLDKAMQDKINSGLIDSVSVGAMVRDFKEGDDGDVILMGIEFVELSLVAVPADPSANFAKNDFIMAVTASMQTKQNNNPKKPKIMEEKMEDVKKLEQEKADLEKNISEMAKALEEYKAKEAKAQQEKTIQEEVEKRILEEKKTVLVEKILSKKPTLQKEDLMKKSLDELEVEEKNIVEDKTQGRVVNESKDDEIVEELILEKEGSKNVVSLSSFEQYSKFQR